MISGLRKIFYTACLCCGLLTSLYAAEEVPSATEINPTKINRTELEAKPETLYLVKVKHSGGNGSLLVGARDRHDRLYMQRKIDFPATEDPQEISLPFCTDNLTETIDIAVTAGDTPVKIEAPVLTEENFESIPPAPDQPEQEIWMNVDYYDMIYYAPKLGVENYREKEIEAMFKTMKERGVTGVLWRISLLGQVLYHSKGASTMPPGRYPEEKLPEEMKRALDIIREFDPLEVAVREARKNGIKIFVWVTVDDEASWDGGPWWSNFILDHPEAAWTDREGKPQWGTLCYSNPDALAYRLNQLKELIEYNTDGIYYSFRYHGATQDALETGTRYGYNKEIVEKYKERFDVDILAHPVAEGRVLYLDARRWNEIKAESYDLLIEKSAELLHNANQELIVDITNGTHQYREGLFGAHSVLNWDEWLKNRFVDRVIVGIWQQMPWEIMEQAEAIKKVAYPDQKIYFWMQLRDYASDTLHPYELVRQQMKAATLGGADGWAFHEYYDLEEDQKYFDALFQK